MQLAYIRVSTEEQNEQRQIEAMAGYGIEKWFTEKVSAKDTRRPKLQELLEFAREGDTVHIHDFSRLARSTKDLLEIVELLTGKGVTLVSNKERIDTSTPTGKLMLTMIGAINELSGRICWSASGRGSPLPSAAADTPAAGRRTSPASRRHTPGIKPAS